MNAPTIAIVVDGVDHDVPAGVTVAVALLQAGTARFRTSVSGEARGPICGIGICFECRVTIDGRPHQRACLVPCAPGMVVHTTGGGDD